MKRLVFAVLAVACAPAAARAGLACTLAASPVQFDSISGTSAGTVDARGSLTAVCTGSQGANIAVCIEIGDGAALSASGQRVLSPQKGSGALGLQIFQDAALSRPWGSAARGQALYLQRTGDGPLPATAYLRAYVQKGAANPGTYSAQFPVTLRYGAVSAAFVDCNALGIAASARSGEKLVASVPARSRRH